MVRYPAEERPTDAVEHSIDRQGEGERRQGEPQDRDWHARNFVVVGDGRKLGDRHQTAGTDHHEHRVHNPEHRRLQDFGWAVVTPRLLHGRRRRRHDLARLWGTQ